MSELWVPTMEPPQIDEDTEREMISRLAELGITGVTDPALPSLRWEHRPFGRYINRWGRNLNELSEEGIWPKQILKRGAALALAAYREAGYFQIIDEDAFEIGALKMVMYGTTETFEISLSEDPRLQEVVAAATDTPELWEDKGGGMGQVLAIGAGSARYYLQQAIAA